jgi:ABC-type sugar transport system permease subunit
MDIMHMHEYLNRKNSNKNKIIIMIGIFFLSVIGTISAFSPFDRIQVVAAAQQQESNNNNNTKLLSLSTISRAIGTGAAANGAIVTVPGFLRVPG